MTVWSEEDARGRLPTTLVYNCHLDILLCPSSAQYTHYLIFCPLYTEEVRLDGLKSHRPQSSRTPGLMCGVYSQEAQLTPERRGD